MAHQHAFQDSDILVAPPQAVRYRTSQAAHLEASVLAEAADVVEAAARRAPAPRTREAALTVVVADHDPDMRAYLKRCLYLMQRAMEPVLEAADGLAALAVVRRAMPDLVVSATHLPEIDGFMLCSAIRDDDVLRHIPVLLISGETLVNASRQQARKAGASGFLSKPFNAQQLCAELESVLPQP